MLFTSTSQNQLLFLCKCLAEFSSFYMHLLQFVSIGTFPLSKISSSCVIRSALFFLLKPLEFVFLNSSANCRTVILEN